MRTVFLKLTLRFRLSVSCPSSRTCSRMLKTSGCAFSISSRRTTEYGLRRTLSVSCPPSSYPTYPGGAPTSRETENFSMYSLMSTRISASGSSKRNLAMTRASSVLPTPGRPEEDEGADRPARVAQAGPVAADRLGDRRDRLLLADDVLA